MTGPAIHPTAIIGKNTAIGERCEIGPYCVIEDDVRIGDHCRLIASVHVGRYARIGSHNLVYPFTTIGMPPQDLKFAGEESYLELGSHNTIREHVTLHRGTAHGIGKTRIGNHNLFMVGSHVAHDCLMGDRNIMSHNASLAGHVEVGEDATIGAYSAVHQYCNVGSHAFIGGFSVVTQDALPFIKTVGNRAKTYGVNTIGLERKGFTKEEIYDLKTAYRVLFLRKLKLAEALERLEAELGHSERVRYLVEFIRAAKRGIVH